MLNLPPPAEHIIATGGRSVYVILPKNDSRKKVLDAGWVQAYLPTMQSKTRPCTACDGTGTEPDPVYNGLPYDCAACDGSGQITDRIPASDAIADAETLRRFCGDGPNNKRGQRDLRCATGRTWSDLGEAAFAVTADPFYKGYLSRP